MSAEQDARRIRANTDLMGETRGRQLERLDLYDHLVGWHHVRVDRRRFLPGIAELRTIHDAQHEGDPDYAPH